MIIPCTSCRKFGSPYQGKATTATRAVLPIPTSLLCLNTGNGMAASLGFLTCVQMLTGHWMQLQTGAAWPPS